MNSEIILKNIIAKFKEQGYAQVDGYNKFGYIRATDFTVTVSRQRGKDTPVSYKMLLIAIDGIKAKPELYGATPTHFRALGITHVTSPVFALVHLLDRNAYL
jgi:Na+-transporting NADH:ubiquinone oxidoreductase subunit NqrE